MVDILVGPERELFRLHKQLLCRICEYFNKALTGNFKEAQENSLALPEENSNAFALFVNWVYRSTVPVKNTSGAEDNVALYNLYIFAEKICLPGLANKAMNAIRELHNRLPVDALWHSDLVVNVYNNTEKGSALRRYCVHKMVFDFSMEFEDLTGGVLVNEEGLKHLFTICNDQDLHSDFFKHLQRFSVIRPPCDPSELEKFDSCYFHEHDAETECSD